MGRSRGPVPFVGAGTYSLEESITTKLIPSVPAPTVPVEQASRRDAERPAAGRSGHGLPPDVRKDAEVVLAEDVSDVLLSVTSFAKPLRQHRSVREAVEVS